MYLRIYAIQMIPPHVCLGIFPIKCGEYGQKSTCMLSSLNKKCLRCTGRRVLANTTQQSTFPTRYGCTKCPDLWEGDRDGDTHLSDAFISFSFEKECHFHTPELHFSAPDQKSAIFSFARRQFCITATSGD